VRWEGKESAWTSGWLPRFANGAVPGERSRRSWALGKEWFAAPPCCAPKTYAKSRLEVLWFQGQLDHNKMRHRHLFLARLALSSERYSALSAGSCFAMLSGRFRGQSSRLVTHRHSVTAKHWPRWKETKRKVAGSHRAHILALRASRGASVVATLPDKSRESVRATFSYRLGPMPLEGYPNCYSLLPPRIGTTGVEFGQAKPDQV
jgi:hypothetical protein